MKILPRVRTRETNVISSNPGEGVPLRVLQMGLEGAGYQVINSGKAPSPRKGLAAGSRCAILATGKYV